MPAQAQSRVGWSRGNRWGGGGGSAVRDGAVLPAPHFRPQRCGGRCGSAVRARSAPRPPLRPHAAPRRPLRPHGPGSGGARRRPPRGAQSAAVAPRRGGPWVRGPAAAAAADRRSGRRLLGRAGPCRRLPCPAAARGRRQDGAREQIPARADG